MVWSDPAHWLVGISMGSLAASWAALRKIKLKRVVIETENGVFRYEKPCVESPELGGENHES
jgi:hypothetical protein